MGTKITDLTSLAVAPDAADVVPIVDVSTGETKKVTTALLVGSAGVPTSRTLTAGVGLTGGGDLTANRSFAVDIAGTNPQPIGTATPGASGKVSDRDHVHAHGAQTDGTHHAVVSDAANGFLDKDVFDGSIGKGKNWHLVWRENYKGPINPKIVGTVSGTGAAAQVAVAGGYLGFGRLVGGTGASSYAARAAALNWWYNAAAEKLYLEWIGTILGPLADATDDYRVHVLGMNLPTGATTGFSLTYDRAAPVNPGNWQRTKWTAGTPNYADTGIAVNLASHRYRAVYDPVAATVDFAIDGASAGQLTAVASVSAATPFVAMLQRVAGASRELYEEFSECWVKYLTARPG